jgi:hypothetical protein
MITTEEEYIKNRRDELIRISQEDALNKVTQLILDYYKLKTQWETYKDLSIPYEPKDFTLCEPHQIPMVKNEYEKIFTYYLKLNFQYWDL